MLGEAMALARELLAAVRELTAELRRLRAETDGSAPLQRFADALQRERDQAAGE